MQVNDRWLPDPDDDCPDPFADGELCLRCGHTLAAEAQEIAEAA